METYHHYMYTIAKNTVICMYQQYSYVNKPIILTENVFCFF